MALELLRIQSWWDIINVLADIMTEKKLLHLSLNKVQGKFVFCSLKTFKGKMLHMNERLIQIDALLF